MPTFDPSYVSSSAHASVPSSVPSSVHVDPCVGDFVGSYSDPFGGAIVGAYVCDGIGGDGDTFEGARYVGEFGEKCTRLILEKAAAMYPCDGVQD